MKRAGRRYLAALGIALAVIVACWAGWRLRSPRDLPPPVPAVASRPMAPLPEIAVGDAAAAALGRQLGGQDGDAAANDVVFLVAAAVRARCIPAAAHELTSMAARARLPVLSGLTALLADSPERREGAMRAIRDIANRAPCMGPFTLSLGPFRRHVSIERYAAAFPDSYADPELDVAPDEYGGRDLSTRSRDDCEQVAYAALPLDAARAWQCTALRAQARARIRAFCWQGEEPDTAARHIHDALAAMPPTCQ